MSCEPAALAWSEAGLTELRLHGLSEKDAGQLLDSRAPGLGAVVRERLLREAAGSPLALIGLPAALRSEHLDEGALLPSRLPLTARLERAFAAQGSGLPSATRSLLLAAAAEDAAAEDADVLAEVLNAAAVLEAGAVTVDAFAPA